MVLLFLGGFFRLFHVGFFFFQAGKEGSEGIFLCLAFRRFFCRLLSLGRRLGFFFRQFSGFFFRNCRGLRSHGGASVEGRGHGFRISKGIGRLNDSFFGSFLFVKSIFRRGGIILRLLFFIESIGGKNGFFFRCLFRCRGRTFFFCNHGVVGFCLYLGIFGFFIFREEGGKNAFGGYFFFVFFFLRI